MAQQLCKPDQIFNPVSDRYRFLGCSIMSASTSIGWNDDGSSLTVTLIQDPCVGEERFVYDKRLNRSIVTTGDPGFTYPNIGTPAYFRLGDWEWCGLIQSYEEIGDEGGNPTFRVILSDMTEVLRSVQVIIGDYAGSVEKVFNIINAYGFMETFGSRCPLTTINGATFGTPAGGFGGSNANGRGMPYNRIRSAVELLTSVIPANKSAFSPYGRIMFRGANPAKDGDGVMKADVFDINTPVDFSGHDGYLAEYFLDLSDLPVAPAEWRIDGTSVSLLDIITQVCDAAGCDYYIELVPVRFGSEVMKIIKIRTVSRVAQPDLTAISDFLATTNFAISTSAGRELRNEPTTALLIGGNQQTLFQVAQDEGDANVWTDNIISPYFGLDDNNNAIIPQKDDQDGITVEVSLVDLNLQLHTPLAANSVTITEQELRLALIGGDEWLSYAAGVPTELGALLPLKGVFDPAALLGLLNNLVGAARADDELFMRDFIKLKGVAAIKTDDDLKDIEKVHQWLISYARDYYGKQFQVRLPYTCVKLDAETNLPVTSEEPSDGGWTEVNVLGLPNPGTALEFFKLPDGRVSCFVKYNDATAIDVTTMDTDSFGIYDGALYVKATLSNDIVWADRANFSNPRVVVTLPQAIKKKQTDGDLYWAVAGLVMLYRRIAANPDGAEDALKEIAKKFGAQDGFMGAEHSALQFDSAAIPLRSNVATYGPWTTRGPAGATQVLLDASLVPWEFGSAAKMNTAGEAQVQESLTKMQIGEMGSIAVPGYPAVPLGAELGAVNNGAFGAGNHLLETRALLTSDFNETDATGGEQQLVIAKLSIALWKGLYGPNVTGIEVTHGDAGVTTTYSMRTFTPKFGRFTKQRIEQLKSIGKLNRQAQRKARQDDLKLNNIQLAIQRGEDRRAEGKKIAKAADEGTPVEVLVGQLGDWDTNENQTRAMVGLYKYKGLAAEVDAQYGSKAMMSLDGLLRPVSKSGDGSLPQLYNPSGTNCIPNFSESPEPPVNSYTPVDVDQDTLDGFPSAGHDVDIVARNAAVPDSLQLPIDEKFGNAFPSDCRFFALKGPVYIQQFGHDLQGKPIPNAADSEDDAAVGNYRDADLEDSFLTGYMRKSKTWPVAPLDLRLDRKRGVWTIPSNFRLITATLDTAMSAGGTVVATVTDGPTLYNAAGASITKKITITDWNSVNLDSGTTVKCYYDDNACEYHIIESGVVPGAGAGDGSGVTVVNDSGTCPTNTATTLGATTVHFGDGLWVDDLGSESARISLGMQVNKFDGINTLAFDGFTLAPSGECGMSITAAAGAGDGSGVTVTNDSGTCPANTATTLGAETIHFGKGLWVDDLGSESARVSLGMELGKFDGMSAISFDGLTVTASGECGVNIANTSSALSLTGDEACITSPSTGPLTNSNLILGKGLIMEDAGGGSTRLGLGLDVGEIVDVAAISFDETFDVVSSGTCDAHISINPSGLQNALSNICHFEWNCPELIFQNTTDITLNAGDEFVIKRQGVTGISIDASDNVLIKPTADLATVQIIDDTGDSLSFFDSTQSASQAAQISSPTGGLTQDSEARAAIDSILTVLEGYGLTANA